MSRIARIVAPEVPHHITQRGNGRRDVFFQDRDRLLYLELLGRYAKEYRLGIWAYCLMSNHIHLVATPQRPDSLARALGRTHIDYARYRNIVERGCGHVWQARFFSCPLDETHLWRAMAYTERNPVRAGMVNVADEYRWSSARAHVRDGDETGILDLGVWRQRYDAARWRDVLRGGVDEETLQERLRDATLRGRAMGSEEFIDRLEKQMGRKLRPNPPGRPRKEIGI
jgi:putative transposase